MKYKNIHSFGRTISDGWTGAASALKQDSDTQPLIHLNHVDGVESPIKKASAKISAKKYPKCASVRSWWITL